MMCLTKRIKQNLASDTNIRGRPAVMDKENTAPRSRISTVLFFNAISTSKNTRYLLVHPFINYPLLFGTFEFALNTPRRHNFTSNPFFFFFTFEPNPSKGYTAPIPYACLCALIKYPYTGRYWSKYVVSSVPEGAIPLIIIAHRLQHRGNGSDEGERHEGDTRLIKFRTISIKPWYNISSHLFIHRYHVLRGMGDIASVNVSNRKCTSVVRKLS